MANVTFIPARPQLGNNVKQAEKPKLRVAAYCRVSTDSMNRQRAMKLKLNTIQSLLKQIQNGH